MSAIDKLVSGFKKFHKEYFEQNPELFVNLVDKGQKPKTVVIACSDSRVDPAIVLQVDPGEIFTVRNVANLVPPFEESGEFHGTSAALEFAVNGLEVENIIVLGHAHCGGINKLMQDDPARSNDQRSFVYRWTSIAHSAVRRVQATLSSESPETQQRACEQYSVMVSLENLMTFPFVRDAVLDGRLQLHGWYVDIKTGELLGYDPKSERFVQLNQ